MMPRERAEPSRNALTAGLLVALLAAVGATAAPANADPRPEPAAAGGTESATAPAEETLNRMRDAGTAMFSWVTDAVADQEWPASEAGEDEGPAAWTRCPSISYEELEDLLVPDYIAELPRTDGWGNPLELCLDREPTPGDEYLAGIRSPGRDGSFEGDTYREGPFPTEDLDRDPVWINGFFVRWPGETGE